MSYRKRIEFVAGVLLVALAVVFSFVVLHTRNSELSDAEQETATFETSSQDEPTIKIVYSDRITKQLTETYTVTGTLDELETLCDSFYPLTALERLTIEEVVMAEAGTEPDAGIQAVANCIYNAMNRCYGDVNAALDEYGYTYYRKVPNDEVKDAVSAIFDRGELLLDDDVLYFCRSDCESAESGWHSEQELVCTIGNHNFYRSY